MARNDSKLKNNCPAGLLVAQKIVPVEYENFYLQSHGGLQGSRCHKFVLGINLLILSIASCPSHYIVKQRAEDIPLHMYVHSRV